MASSHPKPKAIFSVGLSHLTLGFSCHPGAKRWVPLWLQTLGSVYLLLNAQGEEKI